MDEGGHGHHHEHIHQHDLQEDQSRFRPSLQAIFSNWRRSKAPFHVKLGMVIRNNWIKISHGSSCCGHHGEVGC